MTRDRLIQLVAMAVLIITIGASGAVLPGILARADHRALRYTDISVEGAPPFVAIGTMMGALRGVVVDYLWIKADWNKSNGRFFEAMADAELITKLQPRFANVWSFHGHNLAYNISVATQTQQERWEWVNAGLRLVREQGLRHNPNSLVLYKELAFWFAHKVEGVSDDAHQYYKRKFCEEWHNVLGEPPFEYEDRIAWIKAIADAPATLEEAEAKAPGVMEIVRRLETPVLTADGRTSTFELSALFLQEYAAWEAVVNNSVIAEVLGLEESARQNMPRFVVIDDLANDTELREAWDLFLAHLRRRVLIDEYNMDPQLMYEYTRDLGPIDWRHAEAHALYWSRLGSQIAEARIVEYDIYHIVNNDRLQIQAMQGLARSGRLMFDPFSREVPGRLPDPRWVDTIDATFEELYWKHYDTRGGGGETFIAFLQNYLGYSIREWFRAGEIEKAEKLMARLDELFGENNPTYKVPVEVFVRDQTFQNYEQQPHLAPSEVAASLRHGMVLGLGGGNPEIYKQALTFADQVTEYFKSNEMNNYLNRYGEQRIGGLLGAIEQTTQLTLASVMVDRSLPLDLRLTVWREIDRHDPTRVVRHYVYDRIRPVIENELQTSPMGKRFTIAQVLPEPPGMDEYRLRAAQELERKKQEALESDRGEMQTGG